jgi:hypothetical protein
VVSFLPRLVVVDCCRWDRENCTQYSLRFFITFAFKKILLIETDPPRSRTALASCVASIKCFTTCSWCGSPLANFGKSRKGIHIDPRSFSDPPATADFGPGANLPIVCTIGASVRRHNPKALLWTLCCAPTANGGECVFWGSVSCVYVCVCFAAKPTLLFSDW